MALTSTLYKIARKSRDIEVALSMDAGKIIKHFIVNKFIMKKIGKSGFIQK